MNRCNSAKKKTQLLFLFFSFFFFFFFLVPSVNSSTVDLFRAAVSHSGRDDPTSVGVTRRNGTVRQPARLLSLSLSLQVQQRLSLFFFFYYYYFFFFFCGALYSTPAVWRHLREEDVRLARGFLLRHNKRKSHFFYYYYYYYFFCVCVLSYTKQWRSHQQSEQWVISPELSFLHLVFYALVENSQLLVGWFKGVHCIPQPDWPHPPGTGFCCSSLFNGGAGRSREEQEEQEEQGGAGRSRRSREGRGSLYFCSSRKSNNEIQLLSNTLFKAQILTSVSLKKNRDNNKETFEE